MVQMARIGIALQPVATALFANSPFIEGKPSGYLSWRSHVWTDTVGSSSNAACIDYACRGISGSRCVGMTGGPVSTIRQRNDRALHSHMICCRHQASLTLEIRYLSYPSRIALLSLQDPDRCGILPFVFDDDFGFERYAEYALDVPMYFISRCSSPSLAASAGTRGPVPLPLVSRL